MKKFMIAIGVIVLIAGILLLIFGKRLKRMYVSLNSFRDKNLAYTFQHTPEIQPVQRIKRGDGDIFCFEMGETMQLPEQFSFQGQTYSVEQFLTDTKTTALLVIQDDSIRYEKYYMGGSENTLFVSNSIGKSFVSALFGIALSEGAITSVEDPLGTYIPTFRGTALEDIPLKACLQMASGIDFDEENDMNLFSLKTLLGIPAIRAIAKYGVQEKPFTRRRYQSINTEILGEVIVQATGKSLAAYMEEKLWTQIGVQHDAYWTLNNEKELAMGGLSISLRDYARFARLYLHNGRYNGKQILPAQWIKDSLDASAPYAKPHANGIPYDALGYGYQWWIPAGSEQEFAAIGVYGQWIYGNPTNHTIIVKLSADPNFVAPLYDEKNIAFLQELAHSIPRKV
ncbi:MAG: serine hydrolase [Butyricicoccus pullicaecorum]|nr:serine hydrolase [Butyricicoccus pullicaecorum]